MRILTDLLETLKKKSLEIKDQLLQDEYTKYFLALAYLPFVGWLFPLYIKKDDEECQKNGKQGFLLAVFFAVTLLFLSIFDIFLPYELRIARLTIVIIIYLLYLIYFVFCIFGASWAYRGKYLSLPVFGKYAEQLNL